MNRCRSFSPALLLAFAVSANAQAAPAKSQAGAAKPSVAAPASRGIPSRWQQVPIPPLHEFKPQQPKRVELSNGMVIFLQEDHELPLINGSISIRGGGREVPADKTGLVSIYGQSWRTGGSEQKTGDEMDDYLEARAARVETGSDIDSTSLSWSSLKTDFEDVFKLAVELLEKPAFREDKIRLAKEQANTGISRRNDQFLDISSREAGRLAYGPDNPYARIPEYHTIAAITRDDLLAWHHRTVHPNNMIVTVVGDFDSAAMEARLRKAFENKPRGPAVEPAKAEFKPPQPGVYFIAKDDINQAAIRFVTVGIRRDDPDYYAVEVMNEIFFSGGFSARMAQDIRTKRGLAYATGGALTAPFDHPGVFGLFVGTKSGTAVEAIGAVHELLDDAAGRKPATAQELKDAKDRILNSFVFEFDSKAKVVRNRAQLEFYGYPADFLERYRAGVEKTTLEDVARVAQKYIHKDQMAILVVGKSADFDKPLTTLGAVTPVDITIPTGEKPVSASAAPKESSAEGKALLAKVFEGLGGSEKLRAIKAVHQKLQRTQKTPMGEMRLDGDNTIIYPDRILARLQTPMGEMLMVFSPETSYRSVGGNRADIPSSLRDDTMRGIRRDPVYVATHAADYVATVSGSEKVGDVETKVLELRAGDADFRWFVDPRTGHVVRSAYSGGQGPTVVDFSDWKTTDGITLAFKRVVTVNGEQVASEEIQQVEFNPTVDPKLFEKPAASSGDAK